MKWKEFLNKRQVYKKAWDGLKEEYDGAVRSYLNSSYLVIAYGHNMENQFDFKNKYAGSIAMDHPDFFIKDIAGLKLADLVMQYKAVKDQAPELKHKIAKQLEEFDVEFLNVAENQAEVRFSKLTIEYIQEIKKAKHCNKKLTSMSESSIRVILKTEE